MHFAFNPSPDSSPKNQCIVPSQSFDLFSQNNSQFQSNNLFDNSKNQKNDTNPFSHINQVQPKILSANSLFYNSKSVGMKQIDKKSQAELENTMTKNNMILTNKIQALTQQLNAQQLYINQTVSVLKSQITEQQSQIRFLTSQLELTTNMANMILKQKQQSCDGSCYEGSKKSMNYYEKNPFQKQKPMNYISKNPFQKQMHTNNRQKNPFEKQKSQYYSPFQGQKRIFQNQDNLTNPFKNEKSSIFDQKDCSNLFVNNINQNSLNRNSDIFSCQDNHDDYNEDDNGEDIGDSHSSYSVPQLNQNQNISTNLFKKNKAEQLTNSLISFEGIKHGDYNYTYRTSKRYNCYVISDIVIANKFGKIQFLEQIIFNQKPSVFNILAEVEIKQNDFKIKSSSQLLNKDFRLTFINFLKQFENRKVDAKTQIKKQAKVMGLLVEKIDDDGTVVFVKLKE